MGNFEKLHLEHPIRVYQQWIIPIFGFLHCTEQFYCSILPWLRHSRLAKIPEGYVRFLRSFEVNQGQFRLTARNSSLIFAKISSSFERIEMKSFVLSMAWTFSKPTFSIIFPKKFIKIQNMVIEGQMRSFKSKFWGHPRSKSKLTIIGDRVKMVPSLFNICSIVRWPFIWCAAIIWEWFHNRMGSISMSANQMWLELCQRIRSHYETRLRSLIFHLVLAISKS